MTEQEELLPNGGRKIKNDIAAVEITIQGEELTWKKAARQLRMFADMLDARTMAVDGFSWAYSGEYSMAVEFPAMFPHGDYQDAEGNLVHVGEDDMVVSVVWANKDAESEAVEDVHAWQWIRDHGPLQRAGSGTAEPHSHGDESGK